MFELRVGGWVGCPPVQQEEARCEKRHQNPQGWTERPKKWTRKAQRD